MDASWEDSVVYHPELFGPYLSRLRTLLGPTDEALDALINNVSKDDSSGWVLLDADGNPVDKAAVVTDALAVGDSRTTGTAQEAVAMLVRTPPSRIALVVRVCADLCLTTLDVSGVQLNDSGVESLAHELTTISSRLQVLKLNNVNCGDAGAFARGFLDNGS
eukprot:7566757-Pyramimonas_sp.AAC.1